MIDIECPCPATATGEVRHPDGDKVTLKERMDFTGATAVRNALRIEYIRRGGGNVPLPEVMAILTTGYVRYGIADWTLQRDGEDGKPEPIPVQPDTIEEFILSNFGTAAMIGDYADDRFGSQVMDPLAATALRSSQPGPIEDSTSPRTGSPSKPRKPSKPSLTSTTRTDSTGPTSSGHGGDSR